MVHPLTPEILSSLSIREIAGHLKTADTDTSPSATLLEILQFIGNGIPVCFQQGFLV